MGKVITVTANPMLDKTLRLPVLQRGQTHRALSSVPIAGGKGINVSRQIKRLGMETLATGFLGGPIGQQIAAILTQEGIPNDFVKIQSNTREGFTLLEEDGTWTAVFEPPAPVFSKESGELAKKISSFANAGDWLVLSGSVPYPPLDSLYSTLITYAHSQNISTLLDTYGAALRLGIQAKPTIIKINTREYEECFGKKILDEKDCWAALEHLGKISPIAILTRGEGSFFFTYEGKCWRGTPPEVNEVNAVGSGDSMAAGFLATWIKTGNIEEAMRWGGAAGAANAAKWSVADSTEDEIRKLLPGVRLEVC